LICFRESRAAQALGAAAQAGGAAALNRPEAAQGGNQRFVFSKKIERKMYQKC
jgi:hypothetical protein